MFSATYNVKSYQKNYSFDHGAYYSSHNTKFDAVFNISPLSNCKKEPCI